MKKHTTAPHESIPMPVSPPPIGEDQVREAYSILLRYKAGKENLTRRIIENEQWYRLRHWECMRKKNQQIEPASAWLFNCIASKHAAAMDNIPTACVLPREEGDRGEAEKLSAILPVILDGCDFEQVWSDAWDAKCRSGTAIYGVFWDSSKLGGLGDIAVRDVDILSLYWEPGARDIQQSRNLFSVELVDTDLLTARYPALEGIHSDSADIARYITDDAVDTSGKTAVIDWYYKKQSGRRTILHYCKFVRDRVLYATENDPLLRERGLYDHGMYPFIFDVLFPTPGTPAGFGYIDIGKDCQSYIDRGGQAIMKSMLACATPRVLVSEDSPLNEQEFSDVTADIVHVAGPITDMAVRPLPHDSLDPIYLTAMQHKIDELKETTGNRDVMSGGTSSGVTAASAIAAMQEAGSRLDRDACKASYRAFRRVCAMAVELVRQFYTAARTFRILGEDGTTSYLRYSSEAIAPAPQSDTFGLGLGMRAPLFDIEISAMKASPYSRVAQNELALQFYSAGFFDPRASEQALACLDMMDFDRKATVMRNIRTSGERYKREQAAMAETIARAEAATAVGADNDGSGRSGSSGRSGGAKASRAEPSATRNARISAAMRENV